MYPGTMFRYVYNSKVYKNLLHHEDTPRHPCRDRQVNYIFMKKFNAAYAWWKTMIAVGSNFRVSTVERAVTPKPKGISFMLKTTTP